MTTNPGIEVVEADDLESRASALGPTVEQVFETDEVLLVRYRLASGATGWHTHGERDAYGVVLDGRGRLEYGPDGAAAVEIGSGEFFHVPAGVVHRTVDIGGEDGDTNGDEDGDDANGDDANGDGASVGIVALVGPGEPVVEVDGPAGEAASDAKPRVAGEDDLVPTSPLANLTRLPPFPDAGVPQVRGHAAARIESEWHHHGDNHVFGYVMNGEGYMEWGRGEGERKLASAGEFFHVPAGVVHRDVNPSDDEQDYLLWLTGSDPRTVNVGGQDIQ